MFKILQKQIFTLNLKLTSHKHRICQCRVYPSDKWWDSEVRSSRNKNPLEQTRQCFCANIDSMTQGCNQRRSRLPCKLYLTRTTFQKDELSNGCQDKKIREWRFDWKSHQWSFALVWKFWLSFLSFFSRVKIFWSKYDSIIRATRKLH